MVTISFSSSCSLLIKGVSCGGRCCVVILVRGMVEPFRDSPAIVKESPVLLDAISFETHMCIQDGNEIQPPFFFFFTAVKCEAWPSLA